MRWVVVLALVVLAACGADGEPERPEKGTPGAEFGIGITQ